MTQGLSRYQQFLMDTSPIADEYGIAKGIVQPKVNPTIIKNPNPSLQTILSRNIGTTGKGIASGLKGVGGTTAKFAGKASPVLGAGITGYDAFRSYQIADEMDRINKLKPGSFPQEAIDFYRNKGRAITAGAGVGAGAGGILGSGVFSVPGALIGTGVGGGLAGLGYELTQKKNPYANYTITPEQYALLYGNSQSNNTGSKSTSKTSSGSNTSGVTSGNAKAIAQQLASELPQEDIATQQTPEQQANSQAVIDYINKLQEINRPYINSLQNYLNNYDKLARENYARNRYWQGIASITGNPAWSKMADYYNPVTREATKVGLVKQLQDAQAGDLNAINEIMGNMDIATNELGLSPESAFANKNLLTALTANRRRLTDWDKAQLYDATRRYGFDSALNRALAVQNLRNQGALERALINASIYGGGFPGVAPGLNAQGGANTQKEIQLQQAFNGSR